MKKILLMALLAMMLSSCTRDSVGMTDKVSLVHSSPKFNVYMKVIHVAGSYTSHVVWAEDKQGNIVTIATH